MPGRTPADAFSAFIDPLRAAAACLGNVKITPSQGGRTEPGKVHVWTLNGERGVAFPGWHFEAQMHYEMVQGAISREWKVRTHGYRYRLACLGTHVWRIHWHPTLTSSYHLPHVHLNLAGQPGEVPVHALQEHYPTGRMTFEDAVEWVFAAGVDPAERHRDDWREVLSASRDVHVQHRSWNTNPPPRYEG